jgi:hypothetical protein
MWLKKFVTFDIFRITNKYTLLTFRLRCFPFLIRNVSPCYTSKYIEVNYNWFNFSSIFFRTYIFKSLCGSAIYYAICTVDVFLPIRFNPLYWIIQLAISFNVRSFLSVTPFCCDVYGTMCFIWMPRVVQ